jgi:hypothetical protein
VTVPIWFGLTSRELAERSAMPGVRRITATLLALMCTDQLIRSRDDEDFRGEPAALVRDGSPAASHGHDLQGVDLDAIGDDQICARKLLWRWSTPA